jgi:hypothetical protein
LIGVWRGARQLVRREGGVREHERGSEREIKLL